MPCWLPSLCWGAIESGEGHGGRGGDPGQRAAPEVVRHQQVHQAKKLKQSPVLIANILRHFVALPKLPNLSKLLSALNWQSLETQVRREHSTGCARRESECLQGRCWPDLDQEVKEKWIEIYIKVPYFYTNHIFGQNIFLDKTYFWAKRIFGQNLFLDKTYFLTKRIFGQNVFLD